MEAFTIVALAPDQLHTIALPDELAVVLARGTAHKSVSTLKAKAVDGLQRKNHYLTTHTGFFHGTSCPWVMPEFTAPGENALERRWVFHSWAKTLQSTFAARKLVVYMDSSCTREDLTFVEDLVTMFSTPLYESGKWESVRVFAAEPMSVADEHYQLRFQHQLAMRQWINENPDSLTSITMGERLEDFARSHGCMFKTLEERALRDEGMNLLLAVGQAGKKSPSRLHLVGHNLKPGVAPLALVGKGVTFDTGGINLKPHESFVNCMKNDMGGAALMAQIFMGLVEAGHPGPLLLAIPACENAIDSDAVKPGSVIKSRNGKTVLIEHTDAEGRLILADAMSYVWDHYKPFHMYTAATLTTASLRQFTNFVTPVHFATEEFQAKLTSAADACGEMFTFWRPFLPFLGGNKTNAADLTNMGRMPSHASMGGGSNVAAHFLREFAEGPYTHIDIFNSTWNWSGDYPGAHYGATGAPFNSLWTALGGI